MWISLFFLVIILRFCFVIVWLFWVCIFCCLMLNWVVRFFVMLIVSVCLCCLRIFLMCWC